MQGKLQPGYVIDDTYLIKSKLGEGGMGAVFAVEHQVLKKEYAVKVLSQDALDAESMRRFSMEGRVIARMDHPAIVKVHNMGMDKGGSPYYVMDLLHGRSLADYCDQNLPLTIEETLKIYRQVAEGLAYAHGKGIIHRDIKPSNIMLERTTAGLSARIVDFGIAKISMSGNRNDHSQTQTGTVFGSPLYMSPEQSIGAKCDERTDIYSLGCTMFESFTGTPPFKGPSAMHTILLHQNEPPPSLLERAPERNLPDSLDELLGHMLEKSREKRYNDMTQVIHDLDRILSGRSIGSAARATAPASDPAYKLADRQAGKILSIKIVAALSLLLVGGAAVFLTMKVSQKQEVLKTKTFTDNRTVGVLPVSLEESDQLVGAFHAEDFGSIKDLKATKSIYYEKHGASGKTIYFPKTSIGGIGNVSLQNLLAKGTVNLSETSDFTLVVSNEKAPSALHYPEIYKKIPAGLVYELHLEETPIMQEVADEAAETRAIRQGFTEILKIAKSWKDVKKLTLTRVDQEALNNSDWQDGFNDVIQFKLNYMMSFDKNALKYKKFLQHIQFFCANQSGVVDNTLDMLVTSGKFRSLIIDGPSFSDKTCTILSKQKDFASIGIRHVDVDLKLAKELAKIKNIRTLEFGDSNLNFEAVKEVLRTSDASNIVLNERNFTPEQIKVLHTFPRYRSK